MAVSFIGEGNWNAWRKPLTCQKSLTNSVTDTEQGFMVFNVTFNNILVISCWSVLLVEETGVPGENH